MRIGVSDHIMDRYAAVVGNNHVKNPEVAFADASMMHTSFVTFCGIRAITAKTSA